MTELFLQTLRNLNPSSRWRGRSQQSELSAASLTRTAKGNTRFWKYPVLQCRTKITPTLVSASATPNMCLRTPNHRIGSPRPLAAKKPHRSRHRPGPSTGDLRTHKAHCRRPKNHTRDDREHVRVTRACQDVRRSTSGGQAHGSTTHVDTTKRCAIETARRRDLWQV